MKGKHDFIKGRHFYICGEEIDTENCMVLNFSEPLLYYFKKGYEIVKTDRYTLRPKENQIIQFPERKPTLCKILHKNKVIYFTSIFSILRLGTEDDLLKLLKVKELTRDILEEVVKTINDEGIEFTTSSKVAKTFFNNYEFEGEKYDKSDDSNPTKKHFMRDYSCSGLLYQKYHNEIVKNVYVYDINSQFSAILHDADLPYKKLMVLLDTNYERIKNYTYSASIKLISANIKKGRIPLQVGIKNNIVRITEGHGQLLPVTNLDVDYLYNNYDNVKIKFYRVDIFSTRNDLFKDFIEKLFSIKQDVKNEGNAIKYKLIKLEINSFIGRIGSKYSRDKVHYTLHRHVLSYSRISLSNIINKIIEKYGEDSFYYSDTDSIHCSLTPEQFSEFATIGNELGQFKLEHHYDYCEYESGFKSYIGLEDGKVICKLAGIPYSFRKQYEDEFLEKINKLV